MKKIILTIALAFALVLIASPLQSVYASEDDEVSTYEIGDDVVATSVYRVKSKKRINDVYGPWMTVASNTSGASKDGEILGAVVNMSWSNSITGSSSLSLASKQGLTSTMGFDVTLSKTIQVGSNYQVTLKKGEKGSIKVRPAYNAYACKLERKYSGTGVSYWSTVSGTYTSRNYKCPDYVAKTWK